MQVQVFVNNQLVYTERAFLDTMESESYRLCRHFHIDMLKKVGVPAEVVIVGVPSQINDEVDLGND